jgi:hypothetical protein
MLARWRKSPATMVRELFGAEPDPWQEKVLELFAIRPRLAMKASKGPGKTTVIAWCCWNFLLTRPFPNIAATSISYDNLRDGLWKEMAKWRERAPVLKELFEWQTERIFSKQYPATWFMSARSWSKTSNQEALGNTLAGLHSDYIMFVIDESGSIPPAIMMSAEAALSSCVEGHIMQAGNTNTLDGALYEACVRHKHRWEVVTINGDPDDPMRSSRIDIEWARELIKDRGREDPFVKLLVLGEWPAASINALIGPDEVEESMKRQYQQRDIDFAARIFGVDTADEGDDCFDASTEILTNEGWKLFADLHGEELVFSMEADDASWEPIDHIHEYDFDGELNLFEKTHLNFCVTDKHRFLVRSNPRSGEFCFRAWRDLPQDFIVRSSNGWAGTSPDTITFTFRRGMPNGGIYERHWTFDYLDWAEFLGWFVSEGSVIQEARAARRLVVGIAQTPGAKRDRITSLLDRMGLLWRNQPNQVDFSNREIGRWLISECMQGAHKKRVPKSIRDGSPAVIRRFLDSFRAGDGTERADGTGRMYYTSSKLLADDLQEMMAKLGVAGSLKPKEKAGTTFKIGDRTVVRAHDTYVLYERSGFGTFGKTVNKRHTKRVQYTGKIWCVSTRFQSIYVRRNGVPMWSGNSSVIFPRQGLVAFPPRVLRGVSGEFGAGQISRMSQDWPPDAIFVDNTGGYGGTWRAAMKAINITAVPVGFAEEPNDRQYANKRAEMYFEAVKWIRDGGALPNVPEMVAELTQTTYTIAKDRLLLEPKKLVKAKIGRSPDRADGFVLTFAQPVATAAMTEVMPMIRRPAREYDPFAATMGR